jgi:2-polyprenyl-6-methoxyphenol hydroxylase-like FAD-dependent oxidoreductase
MVIGGGIGGLSVALALRRAAIPATIFERQDHPREIGSGLTLWTNAVKALRRLGLDEPLRAISAPLERFEFWS